LSQTPKRPGTRDISELKARLGLKKAAPEKAPAAAKQSGGVAPPPGLAVPGRPTQSQPVIPAASDDPFGNMNAMAQIGTAQRAPEIVIVNDGRPVESVSTGTKAATIGKYVAIALVPLILGWQIGAIGRSAAVYNSGIDAAGKILGNVARAKKDLSDLQSELGDALKKAGGNKVDPSITKVLSAALQKPSFKLPTNERPDTVKEPDENAAVFRIPQGSMEPALAGRVVAFYAHVTQLAIMIDDHVRAAKTDDLAIQQGTQASDSAMIDIGGQKTLKYGIVLSNGPDKDGKMIGGTGANLVELGPLMCADKSFAKEGVCPDGPPGIGVRLAPSGPTSDSHWDRAEVAKATAGQPFSLNQLVILSPTPVLDTLVKGATPSASEQIYQRRVEAIQTMIANLQKEGEDLNNALKVKANTGDKKFTFFL